jgi:hypothetical protein
MDELPKTLQVIELVEQDRKQEQAAEREAAKLLLKQ